MNVCCASRNSDETLRDIINVLQIGVEESMSLKLKLPKIRTKFNEDMSKILLNTFSLYRSTCNIFETAILNKVSVKEFLDSLRITKPLEQNITNDIKSIMCNTTYNMLNDFCLFFRKHIIHCLTKLVNTCYYNGDSKYYIVTGKDECLNAYLSFISIVLGARYICTRGKFVFFVQPYYEKVPQVYNVFVKTCQNNLRKDIPIVLSYRFFDDKYTIKEDFNKIKNISYIDVLHNTHSNIYIACKNFYNEFDGMDYLVFDDKTDEYED